MLSEELIRAILIQARPDCRGVRDQDPSANGFELLAGLGEEGQLFIQIGKEEVDRLLPANVEKRRDEVFRGCRRYDMMRVR